MSRRALQIGLPILFILLGVLGAKVLSRKGEKPDSKKRPVVKRAVEVYHPAPFDGRFVVSALGKTVPAREVTIQAEVTGLAKTLHPELAPGGRVSTGDVLVELEKADYRLAVRQAQAQVEQARVRVQEEEGRSAVAEREWALLGDSVKTSPRGRALALREPQLKSVQANLAAAQSVLAKSRLALKRTTIRAPMNAVVLREGVEAGQRLGPGYGMVTLAGTDRWWVQTSVPQNRLGFIEGAEVQITVHGQGDAVGLPAKIVRRLADLDPAGKMVRVIVEVVDPLRIDAPGNPLYLNDTVEVRFGCRAPAAFALPRKALRSGDRLWLADAKGLLQMISADVYWKDDRVLLVRGLDEKQIVVTSHLAIPTAGTALKWDAPKVYGRDAAIGAAPAQPTAETAAEGGAQP